MQYSVQGQAGLALHRDGSIMSFNILLNSAQDFEGGGTYVEADECAYQIMQGDCFVHSGKLRHGGISRINLPVFQSLFPSSERFCNSPVADA